MKNLILSVIVSSICLIADCTINSGTASEVVGVKGHVLQSNGSPLKGALVRIRPTGYLALNGKSSVSKDVSTDKDGYFYFDTMPADSYTIEINYNRTLGALQQLIIFPSDTFPFDLPSTTVSPTGSICGRINLPISDDTARPWIALYNVEYMVKAPITQDFRFDGVPVGVYSLRIVPSLDSKLEVNLHDIHVSGNNLTDVGTLNFTIQQFFKGCTSFECDSMAVQSILDANGLKGISIHSLIARDSVKGRVIGLNLSSLSVTTIPKDIGSLSRLITLDIRNNNITTLPEQFGYLKSLRECHLDSNHIRDFPAEFVYLCSLQVLTASHNYFYRIDYRLMNLPIRHLDLSYNELEKVFEENRTFSSLRYFYLDNNNIGTIPRALMLNDNIFDFSIRNNRLCSVTESISEWLGYYDGDWNTYQNCP